MFMDVHGCSTTFTDFFYYFEGWTAPLWREAWQVQPRLCQVSEAEQHKNSKATQYNKIGKGRQTGDKRETNSALLRLARCSEPENMLFARTCYLAAHRHATLARHIRPRKWSTRCWHMLAHKSVLCSLLRLKLQKRCHLHCQNALGI